MRVILIIVAVLLQIAIFMHWRFNSPVEALPLGRPAEEKKLWWGWVEEVPGHTRVYSEWLRGPRWVAWVIHQDQLQSLGPRPKKFACTREILWPVCSQAYRRSGFTRGHLAPNYAMGRLYGRAAQQASFSMRNISPQSRALNSRLWQRLEELEMDELRRRSSTPIYIITGPLFNEAPPRLKQGVAVPEGFWRVWLRQAEQAWQALAFVVPQRVNGYEDLRDFIVPVDELEALAGLDLFAALPVEQQAVLESQLHWQSWGDASWWTQPPRY